MAGVRAARLGLMRCHHLPFCSFSCMHTGETEREVRGDRWRGRPAVNRHGCIRIQLSRNQQAGHFAADQALMTWCPLLRPMVILRGFALSATGIRSVSTPVS